MDSFDNGRDLLELECYIFYILLIQLVLYKSLVSSDHLDEKGCFHRLWWHLLRRVFWQGHSRYLFFSHQKKEFLLRILLKYIRKWEWWKERSETWLDYIKNMSNYKTPKELRTRSHPNTSMMQISASQRATAVINLVYCILRVPAI